MLDPKDSRIDYGMQLQPPDGYELDSAVATTYTLDLDTLLTVPIALCFHDTLEGDLYGERLAILEAIGQLKGRVKVFYQAGKIKLPASYNRLFVLLEPWLQPVVPEGGAFSSFHPKFWLLRYVSPDGGVRYRLLVLSRNLTFDRSWDIAASLDGEVLHKNEAREAVSNDRWVEFIQHLLHQSDSFSATKQILNELPRVKWAPPSGFWDPRLLPGSPSFGRPTQLLSPNDALLVMSPFLKDAAGDVAALDELATLAPEGRRWLFSRAEELDAIGEDRLQDWACFSINSEVVDGEERLQISSDRQNLHAKLIVTERGNSTHWHLGSANATVAALGDASDSRPRNTELMLRLTGRTQHVGPETLIEQWVAEDEGQGLFVPHAFATVDVEDVEDYRAAVRKAAYQLIHAQWDLIADLDAKGTYTVTLEVGEHLELPETLNIEVGQLAIDNAYQVLESSVCWANVSLSQISALLPFRVSAPDKAVVEHLVIQVPLALPDGTDREGRILEQLIDKEDKFLNYIRLLLQRQPDKNEWLGFDRVNGQADGFSLLFDESPLFEQLMDAAANHPDTLRRIEKLLQRLEGTNVPIPQAFGRLWPHFRNVIR